MVTLPPAGYLQAAQALCRRYGTLFVLDEIQTGLGRTGNWFALEHWGLEPDFVLVGKALSGGYMPVAAMVTSAGDLPEGGRDARALLRAPVDVRAQPPVDGRRAGDAAHHRARRPASSTPRASAPCCWTAWRSSRERYEMVKEIRGSGLMIGIELGAPSSRVARLNWRLIHMASEGLFPQLIVIPLHRDHGVITMAAGKNDVIKLLPPLTLSRRRPRSFLDALDAVLADCHSGAGRTGRSCATSPPPRCAAPQPASYTPEVSTPRRPPPV